MYIHIQSKKYYDIHRQCTLKELLLSWIVREYTDRCFTVATQVALHCVLLYIYNSVIVYYWMARESEGLARQTRPGTVM